MNRADILSDRNSRNGTSKNFRFWRRCILICIFSIVYALSFVCFFLTYAVCSASAYTGRSSTWSRFHVFIIAFRLLVRPHVLQLCCCRSLFFLSFYGCCQTVFIEKLLNFLCSLYRKFSVMHVCGPCMQCIFVDGLFFGRSMQEWEWMLEHAVHVCNVKTHTRPKRKLHKLARKTDDNTSKTKSNTDDSKTMRETQCTRQWA